MTDHPAASLTERDDQEWDNRRQGDQESTDRYQETDTHENAVLREQVRELEVELERSEHRVQSVIDHYECLLAEKNRELERASEEATGGSLSSLSTLLWWRTG